MPTQGELARPSSRHLAERVNSALAGALAAVAVAVVVAITATAWPILVLPAVGVLLVVVVAVMRLDLALMLLAAAVPLEYSVSFGGGAGSSITLVKLTGGLCFLSFIIQLATRRRHLRIDATHVMLLGILACLLVSTVAAQHLDSALPVTLRYVSYVGLYMVLSSFVGDYRTLERVVWMLSIASAVAGVLAIRNLLIGIDTRATPTYGDPNDLAYILSSVLPLTLWLLRYRGWARVFVLVLIAIISLADALTFSRGAALGLGVAFVWVLFYQRHLIRTALVPILLVLSLVAVVAVAQPQRLSKALLYKSNVASANVGHRFDSWRSALELIATHPFAGVGPGNFQYYNAQVDGRPPTSQDPTVVHNTYLDVGVEVGLPALALLLAYLATNLRRIRVAIRERIGPPSFAIAVAGAMIVAIVSALTLSEQYYAPLWLVGAMVTCIWQDMRMRQPAGSRAVRAGRLAPRA
ncbi:MAG: O-antigen ligase family protein [Candidatus Dormibacteraeota bacterium]|uniref:O-antigen ligase family protein n=1 Tax=Candidatus Aeolococcus gillhamiae TaxID=3127015 RepID=A0A934K2U8_9BACT|nr:O-antigen ligase family protein [Candidatus Dormibacteraeota bacterium]